MEIRKNLVYKQSPGIVFEQPSLTQQHFKDECDIDRILKKYDSTGFLVDPLAVKRPASFGDFTGVEDYQVTMNRLSRIQEYFDSLPAGLRQRFANDPAKLAEFLADERNREEAVKLGLLEDSKPQAPAESPNPPVESSSGQPPAGDPSKGNPA